MPLPNATREQLNSYLSRLYPEDQARDCLVKLVSLLDEAASRTSRQARQPDGLWDERDVLLITYGDQVQSEDATPLESLRRFLVHHQLQDTLPIVHLLPFFPSSSDDGFSVIDYEMVDPALGDWSDVERLAESFDLMFDLVLNHCSRQHSWFQSFLQGDAQKRSHFHVLDPAVDVSQVTRPRSTPLLTQFETARGPAHVWTTFSEDQVDLNYSSPDLLLEMLRVLIDYAFRGARIIRLDAIAYLWKEIGTACIHLPQTHTVVKLMRTVLDAVAPGTILLTETNVPHIENVSYFGEGDEAQMVYQFSLAPLLLDALLQGDATFLNAWLADLEPPRSGTTYLNFTASHDGVGVRPLEGLVPAERLSALVDAVRARGGRVSMRRNADGSESPYELNITYFSALSGPELTSERHIRRFLTSQAIMLALQGLPAVYFHSLVGTPNDHAGLERTGRARSINRRKYHTGELARLLVQTGPQRDVFRAYQHLLAIRCSQTAFHPDAAQELIRSDQTALVSFLRTARDGQQILVLANLSDQPLDFEIQGLGTRPFVRDLISECNVTTNSPQLAPFQTMWLSQERG